MILSFEQRHSRGMRAIPMSDAPDTSGQQELARTQSRLSSEELAWAKDIYAKEAPAREAAATRANKVADTSVAAMEQQLGQSRDYEQYNKSVFRPLETGIVNDAQAYDTPQRQNAEAAAAGADAQMQVGVQTDEMNRNLERSGVAPGSGRSQSVAGSMALAGAKIRAGAENSARRNVETVGFARRMDAASLGRGLASSSATSASTAINAGQGAVGAGNAALAPNQVANAGVAAGYSGAQRGLAGASQTYGNIAQIQQQAASNDSALAGAAGSSLAYIGVAM